MSSAGTSRRDDPVSSPHSPPGAALPADAHRPAEEVDVLHPQSARLADPQPRADPAGSLEPAYAVGGDTVDDAFDDRVLHVAVFDAVGHGLEAATMATVVITAHRHGRPSCG